jgi:predicted amidohydrolase
MDVPVALIQLDVASSESVPDRITRAFQLVRSAAQGSQIVMLPELWHVGAFEIKQLEKHAQAIDGPLMTDLGALAGELGIWLHAGSFAERAADGELFNTSVLFDPNGTIAAIYRKIHLFGFDGGETTVLSGGDELVVVDTPLGPTGLATCYDLRFPELFRALNEGGATSVLLTSGWPTPRIAHWDVLTRARAIENQVWLVACNEVGQQGPVTLGGHSVIIDPTGEVVALAGESEEVLRGTIDPQLSERWRAEFPVLPDIKLR